MDVKLYKVVQIYNSVDDVRHYRKLDTPVLVGYYKASSALEAQRRASFKSKIPGLFLHTIPIKSGS